MVELLLGLVQRAAQGVDPQVDGRTFSQRPALVCCLVAKGGLEPVRQPFGIIAAHMIGRAFERARGEALAFLIGEDGRRILRTGEKFGDGLDPVAPHLAQCAQQNGAGLRRTHDPGARSLPAQGIENQRAQRAAILRPGEAMRLAPFLQGFGGRTVLPIDDLENFDGGGDAGGGCHLS